jgi:hypothetical protein
VTLILAGVYARQSVITPLKTRCAYWLGQRRLAFTRDCPPMNLDVSRRLRLESNQSQLKRQH